MAYADQAGLVARFGESEILRLADRDQDGAIDTEVVTAALDDASAEIDAYVGSRYSVPITPAPSILTNLCGDIARYKLSDECPLDEVEKRYDKAVRMLRDIAAGKASLPVAGDPLVSSSGVSVSHSDDDRIFTQDTLRGF